MKPAQPTLLSGEDDDVLFRLELMVARRADALAREPQAGGRSDRQSWQQAEVEVFGDSGELVASR